MRKKSLYGRSRLVPKDPTAMEMLSWILRGRMRKTVLENAKERRMPSDIVKNLSGKEKRLSASTYAQVSRSLAELESVGLVRCLNPKEKTGRLYEATPK